MYIKLRQIQTHVIESSRDIKELLDFFPQDGDKNTYVLKNTDLPWSSLINEETLERAAKCDVVYFAENNLNNVIITDTLFDKSTTLINYIRFNLYEYLNDDDDSYIIISTDRNDLKKELIVVKEHEI